MLKSNLSDGDRTWTGQRASSLGDEGFILRRILQKSRGRRVLMAISFRELRIAFPAAAVPAVSDNSGEPPVEQAPASEEAAFRDDLSHFLEREGAPDRWQD